MKLKFCIIVICFLTLECAVQMFGLKTLHSQNTKNNTTHQPVVLDFKLGFSEDGAVSSVWQEAIKYLRHKQDMSDSPLSKSMLLSEEALWANLIKNRILIWQGMIDSLRIPFKTVTPPYTVTILLGNQGGEDAFIYSDSTICFDLNKLSRIYGTASELLNSNRIDRFFAHEFTHILHKAWRKKNAIVLESPFDYALWECLTEGFGNYRSLSDKWLSGNGKLTKYAVEVLERLQPVFVERISSLVHAPAKEVPALMEGLSVGAFDQKWGALTVALWLAQEAKNDDLNLQKWVNAGPTGILLLAQKYLPKELKGKMPNSEDK